MVEELGEMEEGFEELWLGHEVAEDDVVEGLCLVERLEPEVGL